MNCTHQEDKYEDIGGYYDWDGNYIANEQWTTVNTVKDIDTYHYQCTQCGEVFTYHGYLFTSSNKESF